MSMISALIDELRKYADRADGTFPMLASALRDAADTIGELRGALQVASVDYRHLADENAKLRELVRHMNTCIEHYEPDGSIGCEHCPLDNDAGNCDYERRMRELGVEVDG